jgi:excinuclease ABC subunit C
MNEALKEKLENLPNNPGIYQFKDVNGTIIYVGKAKNLKNRVRSYFQSNITNPKTLALVNKINDLEMIITSSEVEALVLENNLIKELKPRYNINLKDDKTYPYIRITNEPYPQIYPTRNIIRDGSKYFGPFTDVKSMKASLRLINKIFKIRSCKYELNEENISKGKYKVCLDYHIKKCDGPCENLISREEYNNMVQQAIKVFRGKTDDLIKELKEEMLALSANFEFEKAAAIRDKIEQLTVYTSKQRVVSGDTLDKDIIAVEREDKDVAASILNIRYGKLISKRNLKLSGELDETPESLYASVLRFYYNEYVDIPDEIIVETLPEESEYILNWLFSIGEKKPKFVVPLRKSEAQLLLKMCKQNALLQLGEIKLQRLKREKNVPHVLMALKRDLMLKNIPNVIECFDISHLQGTDTVASMVVFENGKPKKSLYRKFIIKTVEGVDDFASMQEVITRRYTRVKEENLHFPELIMVDGGKGQLSSAIEALKDIGFEKFEIIGLAKRLEEVFLPGQSEAISIPKTSSSLKLLQQIRDEAHRFAITFHRERRSKRTFSSELEEIKGIGKAITEKLLKAFSGVEEIKKANIEDIEKVIGKSKAKIVFDYFNNKDLEIDTNNDQDFDEDYTNDELINDEE